MWETRNERWHTGRHEGSCFPAQKKASPPDDAAVSQPDSTAKVPARAGHVGQAVHVALAGGHEEALVRVAHFYPTLRSVVWCVRVCRGMVRGAAYCSAPMPGHGLASGGGGTDRTTVSPCRTCSCVLDSKASTTSTCVCNNHEETRESLSRSGSMCRHGINACSCRGSRAGQPLRWQQQRACSRPPLPPCLLPLVQLETKELEAELE